MSETDDASGPSGHPARPPRPSVDVQIAAERLLDDETLRESLSDEGFAPILEVALALILRRHDRFASTDSLADAARSFVKTAVSAAETGSIADLGPVLVSRLFEPAERSAILGADLSESADADARAGSIAERVARVCALGSVQ